jgi:hypothetical protein
MPLIGIAAEEPLLNGSPTDAAKPCYCGIEKSRECAGWIAYPAAANLNELPDPVHDSMMTRFSPSGQLDKPALSQVYLEHAPRITICKFMSQSCATGALTS